MRDRHRVVRLHMQCHVTIVGGALGHIPQLAKVVEPLLLVFLPVLITAGTPLGPLVHAGKALQAD